MKKLLMLALVVFFACSPVTAEEASPWARYLGVMDGSNFPIIFLSNVEGGETVSKTGVYLYKGEDHPVLGVIQGSWDSWTATLKGRWQELELVGDDLQDMYGGDLTLVISDRGIDGFRKVDGDDGVYGFKVGSAPAAPDDEERSMFLSMYFKYRSWLKDQSN